MSSRSRPVAALLVLLLLAAGALIWLSQDPGATASTAAADVVAQDSPGDAERVTPAAAERERIDATPAEAAAATNGAADDELEPTATTAVVHGRFVDAITEQPIAGLRVWLRGEAKDAMRLARYEHELRWQDPEPCETGRNGRFTFRIEPEPPLLFRLDLGEQCWLGGRKNWPAIAPGQRIDAGDLLLHRVVPCTVRVVDRERTPVPGVRLYVYFPTGIAGEWGQSLTALSNADGIVRLTPGLPEGLHSYQVEAGGPAAGGSGNLLVRAGAPPVEIVVARERVALAGTILDQTGAPVPSLQLWAMGRPKEGGYPETYCHGTTDERGGFTLTSSRPAERGWTLSSNRPFADPAQVAAIPDATRDLRLIVTIPGSISLQVVDATDGKPIERFAAGWYPEGAGGWRAAPPPVARHRDGSELLEGFPPGNWRLVVHPGDPAYAVSAPTAVTVVAGGTTPLRVALQRASVVTAQVRHQQQPVADARVELLLVGRQRPFDPRHDYPAPGLQQGAPFAQPVAVAGSGTTDGEGRAVIPVLAGGATRIRVRADGFVPLVQELPAGAQEVTLELKRGAGLEVQLRPPGVMQQLRQLSAPGSKLSYLNVPRVWFTREGNLPLEQLAELHEDCTIVGGIEPGVRNVTIQLPGLAQRLAGRGFAQMMFEQRLTFRAGERTRYELDLTQCRPGTLELTLVGEHGPLARQVVTIHGNRGQDPGQARLVSMANATLRSDANGHVGPILLPPGQYGVTVAGAGFGVESSRTVRADQTVDVHPGGATATTLLLRLRGARLTLLGGGGEPLANLMPRLILPNGHEQTGPSTDALGRWTFQGEGRVRVEVRADDHKGRAIPGLTGDVEKLAGEFTVPDLPGLHELDVRLSPVAKPAPKKD